MPFITQGKTNWKFLVIVIILAVIVGGVAFWYAKKIGQPYQIFEIHKTEKTSNAVTLKTDKESYKQGEDVNIILDTGGKDIYLQKNIFSGMILFSKEYEVYRLQGTGWTDLRINTYCGNVAMCGTSGLIHPPCPAPAPSECNKVVSPMNLTWDQEVYEYVTKDCNSVSYQSEESKQVGAGTYKVRVNYYDSSSCGGEQKYLETQFKITDETANWKTSIKELGINLKLSNEFIEVFGLPYKSYEKEGKVGKAINFNFAMMNDYRGLMLTAYTSNYEPPLNETWAFNDWVGAKDVVKTCPKQLEYSSDRVCKIMEINEEKAIFETYLSFLEASCMFDVRVYFNNHSSSQYKGLNFSISLPDTSDKICEYYYLASEDNNSEALKSEFYTQSKNIMENKNLSEEDGKRLRLFEQMLSTLKFLD
jgi:hypothetical protein